tara:strand:+ start:1936 stop:2928 length:993 start_codon:yes stop_codon:yes gene_type:complete
MKAPDLYVGKQLFVGSYLPDPKGPIAIGIGPAAIRGAMYCAGPALFGNATTFIAPEATMMVGRVNNLDFPIVPSIFKVSSRFQVPTPIDVVLGDIEGPVGIFANATVVNATCLTVTNYVSPVTNWVGTVNYVGMKSKLGKEIQAGMKSLFGKKSQAGVKVQAGVNKTFGLKADAGGMVAPKEVCPVIVGRCTGNKGFDIPHPTQEKKRVRHICVEGPESAIYIRGKLDGTHIIELPEYWKGLVNYDTITVNLTPFGRSDTSLHVKEVTEDKIIVSSDHLVQVKCFYQVWVDRLGPELIVEYEGESPADYPGDQSGHSIAGYNYDVREEEL